MSVLKHPQGADRQAPLVTPVCKVPVELSLSNSQFHPCSSMYLYMLT